MELMSLIGLMELMGVRLGRGEGSVGVAAEWLNVRVMYRLCIGYVSVIVGSRLGIDPILSFMR